MSTHSQPHTHTHTHTFTASSWGMSCGRMPSPHCCRTMTSRYELDELLWSAMNNAFITTIDTRQSRCEQDQQQESHQTTPRLRLCSYRQLTGEHNYYQLPYILLLMDTFRTIIIDFNNGHPF